MEKLPISFKQFGDTAILIEWPERIDEFILDDILRFKQTLSKSLKLSVDIVDVVNLGILNLSF